MKKRLLAGLSRAQFMRRHWQKEPLLARAALPEYAADGKAQGGGITRHALFALAARDDVESRVIIRTASRWQVRHGPFTRAELARLPARNWTLLVQGVDQSHSEAARLLHEFSFIPFARLDDVMVSYAAPGGGVGPHFDSYDVFLVQGRGARRWRISRQRDLALKADMPLKILERFVPEQEWTVQPGDLLYLPPQYAHDGVALDECITYSVGFRAPAAQELASAFLDFVHDGLELEGRYSDPGLAPTDTPGRVPPGIVRYARSVLDGIRWSGSEVERFVGTYLTEPKSNVVFTAPRPRLAAGAFARSAQARGVRLAAATRMLISRDDAFVNGERTGLGGADGAQLAALADARELPPRFGGGAALAGVLYAWYEAGYIELRQP